MPRKAPPSAPLSAPLPAKYSFELAYGPLYKIYSHSTRGRVIPIAFTDELHVAERLVKALNEAKEAAIP